MIKPLILIEKIIYADLIILTKMIDFEKLERELLTLKI